MFEVQSVVIWSAWSLPIMCNKTEHLLKQLENNRPKGVVALRLVEGTQNGLVRYYVRCPVKMGPQPLLGVTTQTRSHTFFGKNAYTPVAVCRAAAKGNISKGIPIEITWSDLVFSDALTVLPQSEADRAWAQKDITTDPVLLSAFSVVAAHYETQVTMLDKDAAFIRRIPASVEKPPYKPAIVGRMQALAQKVLDEQDEETIDSPGNRLARIVLVRLTRWHLWNQVLNGATISEQWSQYWKILKAWNRWQAFDMTWRERAKEMADNARSSMKDDEYVNESEGLRVFCSRMGLSAQRRRKQVQN